PPIRLAFSEVIDPLTVTNNFTVTDSTGAVPGTFDFDLETMTSFTFIPSRDLTGASVTVNAATVEDLGGNSNAGNTFAFNLGNDSTAPTINTEEYDPSQWSHQRAPSSAGDYRVLRAPRPKLCAHGDGADHDYSHQSKHKSGDPRHH
ncbi:MAG TPA: hypothetical protein EYO33_31435, partial [Phycisphaerales bacterium]|nr:hypothetical protein [Phycisphaerales bacterium]